MVKHFSARADAHVPTSDSSALLELSQIERHQIEQHKLAVSVPTFFACNLEKTLYFAALSDARTVLKNLAELRATRVSKSMIRFLKKHEAFAPLLARLTKNYWLTLTEEEKSHRTRIRHQSVALKRAQELLDGISVRKKNCEEVFQSASTQQADSPFKC